MLNLYFALCHRVLPRPVDLQAASCSETSGRAPMTIGAESIRRAASARKSRALVTARPPTIRHFSDQFSLIVRWLAGKNSDRILPHIEARSGTAAIDQGPAVGAAGKVLHLSEGGACDLQTRRCEWRRLIRPVPSAAVVPPRCRKRENEPAIFAASLSPAEYAMLPAPDRW